MHELLKIIFMSHKIVNKIHEFEKFEEKFFEAISFSISVPYLINCVEIKGEELLKS